MGVKEILAKKGFKELLTKIIIFVAVFIGISAVLGQLIVKVFMSKLHFYVYGGLGYAFLFVTIAFILLTRKRLLEIKEYKYGKLYFGIISLVMAIIFYYYGIYVNNNYDILATHYIELLILSHTIFLSIFIFLALSVFGIKFIKDFLKEFRKELIICGFMAVLFYFSMFLVWRSWEIMSTLVANIVYHMLNLTFSDVTFIPPRTIGVNGFIAQINEPCSGVYSIFLFTCLYLFILFLDWKVVNKKKFAILFLPTVIGLFFVNCLRIYLLMLTGVFISPDFAVNMFHSYIGTILFIIYFVLFWVIFYKWMKK